MALQFVASRSTTLKMTLIGIVVLVLLVPLTMLRHMVQERSELREQAFTKVAAGWGGGLTLGGPLLIVPTERTVVEGSTPRVHRDNLFILPARLDFNTTLRQEKEPRYVGIYQVPVYVVSTQLTGSFDFSSTTADFQARYPGITILWEQAHLRVALSEVRSLRELGRAKFAGEDLAFTPAGRSVYAGMDAPVYLVDTAGNVPGGSLPFDVELTMAGSRELSFLPLGGTTTARLRADWPAPSFQGAFLPASRLIDEQGFAATWQVLQLNRSFGQSWLESDFDPQIIVAAKFGAGLYQAVDVYQRSERAMKYALLFIALTFITFFAWEHLASVRLHPLQYLFVGLALSVFYLLLIALSEHISFAAAYWSAAAALVTLIGTYLAGALRKRERGAIAGAAMTVVYGVLYALVISENYALLMGALVLFAALGAVMLVTRNVDWYAAGNVETGDAQ